jgi:hypothetical protein
MIAFCGIVCTDCPLFIATQKNDYDEKKKIAELWSTKEYPLSPENMFCDGCLPVGKRTMSFCADCGVRRCGLEKNVQNCAHCADYPCGTLDKVWEKFPPARDTLEEIRKDLAM